MQKTMQISGMMCPRCEARVKKALEALEGVTEAQVSHEKGCALVTGTAELADDVLRKAVREDVANKLYKEAKFNFRYVYHSQKEPQRVLLDITYTEKDYNQQ